MNVPAPLALDNAMRQLLAELATLSHGNCAAWNSSGGGRGKPGSVLLHAGMLGEVPHEHYARAYNEAAGPTSKRAVYDEALAELEAWRGRGERERPEGETSEERDARMLVETRGSDPVTGAQAFRDSATRLRKLRIAAGLDPERGYLVTGLAPVDAVAKLKRSGMSQRQIAAVMGVSQPTVHRLLGQADRLRRAA